MPASISAFSFAPAQAYIREFPSLSVKKDQAPGNGMSQDLDRASISSEGYAALEKGKLEQQSAGQSPWETRFGLQAGTTILDTGNRQIVTLDGDSMEILEYRGERLVRRESGDISKDSVVKNVETFDARGNVASSVRTSLTGDDLESGSGGTATLSRETALYENGQIVRTLAESTKVTASYDNLDALDSRKLEQAAGIEDFIRRVSGDATLTGYHAEIQDYVNGNLSGSASISRSITELGESSSISMSLYDGEGQLRCSVNVSNIANPAVQMRSIGASWYEQGELVKQSQGSFTLEAGKENRENLSIDGILAEYSEQREKFQAEGRADGPRDAPQAAYSVHFEDTLYKDGELAYKTVDHDQVAGITMREPKGFKPGKGLMEYRTTDFLRKTSHVEESYEDGKLMRRSAMEYEEFMVENDKHERELHTRIRGELQVFDGAVNASQDIYREVEGGIDALDSNADAAMKDLALIDGLALAKMRLLFTDAGLEGASRERADVAL